MALENLTSQEQVPLQNPHNACFVQVGCCVWLALLGWFSATALASYHWRLLFSCLRLWRNHMTWVEVFTGWISHIDKVSSPDSWGVIQEIPPLSPGHQTFLTIFFPLTQFQCPGLLMLLREGLRLEGSCAVRERQCHHDHCFILWNFRCANPDWSSDFGIALDVFFCNCRGLLLYTHFNYSRTHAPVFIRLTDLFMETRHNQSEQASNHPHCRCRLSRSIQINEMPRRMLWQMHCSQLVCVLVPLVCFACSTLEQPY